MKAIPETTTSFPARLRMICAGALVAAPLAIAGPVMAGGHTTEGQPPGQGAPQEGAPPQQEFGPAEQQATQVDEATLDRFVQALAEVDTIQMRFAEEREQAADADAARELEEQAQMDMIRAVEETGLNVADYNAIVQQMTADPELQQEVSERLDDIRGDG